MYDAKYEQMWKAVRMNKYLIDVHPVGFDSFWTRARKKIKCWAIKTIECLSVGAIALLVAPWNLMFLKLP